MNSIKKITAFLASLLKPHPGRDWFIMFILMSAVLIAVIVYAAYLFIGINSGRIVGVAAPDLLTPPSVTRGDINKAIDSYQARALNFNERNLPLPTLFDPSK